MNNHYLDFAFDPHSSDAIQAFDEAPLWSAVFGALLLKHVPLSASAKVLDLGCGTGFPTLELAGRIGPAGEVWGIDPWAEALARAREKARICGLSNVHYCDGDAAKLPFDAGTFDLITSNLGVNNFIDAAAALAESRRVLKPGGRFALTTNLCGHMSEFYVVFADVLRSLRLLDAVSALEAHVAHRHSINDVRQMLAAAGLDMAKVVEETYVMRFASGSALLNHYFIKLGFLDGWKSVVPVADQRRVFEELEAVLNDTAARAGALAFSVPMAYIEAVVA